jgi:alpha-galactosidase
VFDCTEEHCEEIYELYKTLAEQGYRYFKVDAIRHLMYDGLQSAVRRGLIDNAEAERRFRNYMQAVRRGIGEENYLLSCWGVLTPNVGICDGMRFATDATARDSSFRMQVDESARWHHTHGILYRNDPDYICLRMDEGPARAIAAMVTLNGYLYMISDEISLYDEARLDIARKTIPPVEAATAETGPLRLTNAMNYYRNSLLPRDGETLLSFGNLWTTHFAKHGRRWAVAQLIRTMSGDAPAEQEVPLESLGLDPAAAYAVFDFWRQKPLGFVSGSVRFEVPEYRDSTILSFTPVGDEVQLVASSRHVSMDAVSVTGMARNEGRLTVTVAGPVGTSADYWFALPEGARAVCEGCDGFMQDGRFVKCCVKFDTEEKEISLLV